MRPSIARFGGHAAQPAGLHDRVARQAVERGVQVRDRIARRRTGTESLLPPDHPPAQLPARHIVQVHGLRQPQHAVRPHDVGSDTLVVVVAAGKSNGGPGQVHRRRECSRPRCPALLAQREHEGPKEAHRLAPVVRLPHAEFEDGEPVGVEVVCQAVGGHRPIVGAQAPDDGRAPARTPSLGRLCPQRRSRCREKAR